jgi:hypothetical protein
LYCTSKRYAQCALVLSAYGSWLNLLSSRRGHPCGSHSL